MNRGNNTYVRMINSWRVSISKRTPFMRKIVAPFVSKTGRACIIVIFFCGISIWTDETPTRTGKSLVSNLFSNAESIAIGSAAVVFFLEIPDRKKRDQYEAWQVINSGLGQTGSGGRIQALEDLNRDGVDLEGIAAPKADLSRVNLSRGKLNRANFEGTQLDFSILNAAKLNGANLMSANLSGAKLHGANLMSANLSGAKLHGAELHGANLMSANLSGAKLHGAELHGANLSGATLSYSDLEDAELYNADLSGVRVTRARFGLGIGLSFEKRQHLIKLGAIFNDMSHANLSGADLKYVRLNHVKLNGADLSGADLSGADLNKGYCKRSCHEVP